MKLQLRAIHQVAAPVARTRTTRGRRENFSTSRREWTSDFFEIILSSVFLWRHLCFCTVPKTLEMFKKEEHQLLTWHGFGVVPVKKISW